MKDTTMLIELKACPRCGNARTVRLRRELSLCVNCKLQWSPRAGPAGPDAIAARARVSRVTDHRTPLAYPFTPRELRRLTHYRAAVAAGFYTDALATHVLQAAIRRKA
jgi:hypothetical protein